MVSHEERADLHREHARPSRPPGTLFQVDHLSADPLVADAFADPLTRDTALLRAAAAGSRQAFALFARRYETAAYGWALHALGSPEYAFELCRELFMRTWQRSASAPPDVCLWLQSMAFEVATAMGAPAAADQRDLDAVWLGGVVKESLGHLPARDRALLEEPRWSASEEERIRTLAAMDQLRLLLAARGIGRRSL